MLASKKTKRGVIGAVVLAGVLAVSGYALTNSLTYEEASTLAGNGDQEVQVLEVQDVDYALDATDKTEVESITFTLDSGIVTGAGDAVAYMQINDTAGWETCTPPADAATTVVCPIAVPATGNIADIGESTEELKLVLAE